MCRRLHKRSADGVPGVRVTVTEGALDQSRQPKNRHHREEVAVKGTLGPHGTPSDEDAESLDLGQDGLA